MATIKLNDQSTTDLARNFVERFDLSANQDGRSSGGKTSFIENPLETYQSLKGLLAYIDSEEGGQDVKQATNTRAVIETLAFNEPNQTGVFKLTLTGTGFLSEGQETVTGLSYESNGTDYATEQKLPTEIESSGTEAGKLNLRFTPSELLAGTGSVLFVSQTNSESGFEHWDIDGQKVKYTGKSSGSQETNTLVSADGNVQGLMKSWLNSWDSKGEDGGKSTGKIDLKSTAGLSFNTSDTWSGVVNSLSLSQSYAKGSYLGAVSYTDKAANSQIADALTRFAAGTGTLDDIAAALMSGNDKITLSGNATEANGYAGNDQITCGKGIDTIVFSTALNAATNVDRITSFKKAGADKIALDLDVFAGADAAESFVVGTAATSASHRIIYDRAKGALYYDADGNGAAAAVQFATLVGKVTLSASDFITV